MCRWFENFCNERHSTDASPPIFPLPFVKLIQVSRAFGDPKFKPYGVIATPSVNVRSISSVLPVDPETTSFIVLGCDGVWKVLDGDSIAKIVSEWWKRRRSGEGDVEAWRGGVCEEILRRAVEKGADDNLTVLVVKVSKGTV